MRFRILAKSSALGHSSAVAAEVGTLYALRETPPIRPPVESTPRDSPLHAS